MSYTVTHDARRQYMPLSLIEAQFHKSAALLLPLRIFIGLGWLRAGVEKLTNPDWLSGVELTTFLHAQIEANMVYFPFYEWMIHQVFEPNVVGLSLLILVAQLLAGAGILTGTLTNAALLGALFMNLNFVLLQT